MDTRHCSRSLLTTSIAVQDSSAGRNVALMEKSDSYALESSRLKQTIVKNELNPRRSVSGVSGNEVPMS